VQYYLSRDYEDDILISENPYWFDFMMKSHLKINLLWLSRYFQKPPQPKEKKNFSKVREVSFCNILSANGNTGKLFFQIQLSCVESRALRLLYYKELGGV